MADIVIDSFDLDTSGFESGIGKLVSGYDEINQKTKSIAQQTPFKKQADDLLKFNNQLKSNTDAFKRAVTGPNALKSEFVRLSQEALKYITNSNKAAAAGDWKATQQKIKDTKAELDGLDKKLDETATKQTRLRDDKGRFIGGSSGGGGKGGFLSSLSGDSLLSGAGSLLGAFGIGLGAKEIVEGIVSVRAEYQRLGKQLEVSLGSSSAGAEAQRLITDFANKTPHEIAGVTSAFNRLVGIGIVPTEKQLFQLSDIALANGKTISDYVEAIADAQTGEFERLKEFGIKASKNNDQVTFSFKGQITTVKDSATAIDDYLLSLGNIPGIAGQTEEAGKLLEGRWSTLKDTFAGVANELGEILQPAMEAVLDVTQRAAEGLSGYIKDLRTVSEIEEKKGVGGKGSGGLRAFFRSIFDPHGFNADATEALIQANEQKLEDSFRSGDYREGSALDQKRAQLEAQQRQAEIQRKALADQKEAEKEAKKQATKQKQIALDITREEEKQVGERKRLQIELVKLQAQADKQRLELLDKDSFEYIELKKKLDLAEIEQERKHLIELGQVATGTPYYNRKTQRVEVRKNTEYTLPKATEDLFQSKRDTIESGSQVDAFTATIDQGIVVTERKLAAERASIQRQSNEQELELRQKLIDADQSLMRKAGESEQDYEKRKNEALLKIRLEYYQKLLELAEKDPSQKAQILGLKETIAGLQKDIKTNSAQLKTGPQDLWDLLGITFDQNAEKNDQFKQLANEAAQTVISTANSILTQQLQSDQQRISSIDAQLQAKQNEVQVEAELAAAGLANNLDLRRQEEAAIQAERAKAVEAQRRDQAIQLALNAVLQESEMALAVAKIFSANASIPLVGYIAAGIQIAAMIALFASTVSQISNLPKYHDGDEVTADTARKRSMSGSRRGDEIDARLQIGEGVTRKQAYQPNKKLFSRLNTMDRALRSSDMAWLLDGTGVELPESVKQGDLLLIQQMNEQRATGPDYELHRRVDSLADRMDTLIDETRKGNRKSREQLPNGKVRETDEHGNVTIVTHV